MIRNIQLLRGVAAMLVVLCHSTWFWGPSFHWLQQYSFAAGFAGVDLFFVISGYVISRVAMADFDQRNSRLGAAGKFALDRVARIYPIYWVVLLAAIGLSLLLKGAAPEGISRSNIMLITPSPALSVTWTLMFEVYFYAMMAALMVVSPRHFRRSLFVAATIYVLVVVVVQVFSIQGTPVPTRPIALDFAFGMFVFLIADSGRRLPARTLVALGAGGLLFGTYLMMGDPWSKSDYRAYALGFPSAFLLVGMIALESRWRAPAFFVAMGNASYSIYLWHDLVLETVRILKFTPPPSLLSVAVTLVLMATLGWLSWRFIEQPIAKGIKKLRHVVLATAPSVKQRVPAE